MKAFLPFLLAIIITDVVMAQDAYHTDLQNTLATENNLPAADWLFFDNESAIINGSINYGHGYSVQTATDEPFSQMTRHVVTNAGANPWNASWSIRNNSFIQSGDKVLTVFYIRSVNGPGKVNFFVENASTFAKEAFLTLDVDEEWRRYYVPFSSSSNFSVDDLVWGFHLAFQAQTIEVGGFTAMNFENDVTLEQLPQELNNEFYDGYQADASWRAPANERIEQLRKTDLNVSVVNSSGEAVENAAVQIEMQRHEFAFGTAVTAERLANNNNYNVIYESKITNLDGEGHGFNWVVFENDMKWPGWENGWFVTKEELVNAVSWLRDQDIQIRGHNLIWPGVDNLPGDIADNIDDLAYIRNRFNGHFQDILTYPGIAGQVAEWDVINEIVTNRSLELAFQQDPNFTTGRELYGEIFTTVNEIDPNTGLWLNDFVTLTLANEAGAVQYENLKQYLGEIINSGAPIDGIGFQGHIGGSPNGIPSVLSTYDDFYDTYGLKAKVTEFDMASIVSEELGAQYLSDFLRATFSHPSMDGFLFWNFWDGATWQSTGSNFYRLNWDETPALDAFNDLVFDEWWTDEVVATNASGEATTRVFKGTYLITYTCEGEEISQEIDITNPVYFEITCDNITTNTQEGQGRQGLKVFPNPAQEMLFVENPNTSLLDIQLTDFSGRLISQTQSSDAVVVVDVKNLKGLYLMTTTGEHGREVQRVVVE